MHGIDYFFGKPAALNHQIIQPRGVVKRQCCCTRLRLPFYHRMVVISNIKAANRCLFMYLFIYMIVPHQLVVITE